MISLAHHVAGRGTPQLVLVHGLFESADSWAGVAPLLVRAQHSAEVSPAEAARVRSAIPHCDFVEIADVGHDLHLRRPREFAAAVATWVRRRVPAGYTSSAEESK